MKSSELRQSAPAEHEARPSADHGDDRWDALFAAWQDSAPQTLWRRHHDAVNCRLLERWLPARCSAILKTDLWDEAVGDGLYPTLESRSDEVVGIDVSNAVVAEARRRHPELVADVADVRRLPFASGRFDAVVSNSTLDHFDSPDQLELALAELHRVLRPGGVLVVTLDNPKNPLVAIVHLLPRRALNRVWLRASHVTGSLGVLPYHVGVTLGRRRLLTTLARIGFEPDEVDAIVHAPRLPAVVLGRIVERGGSSSAGEAFLRGLGTLERLGGSPARFVTGYFVAVRAVRAGPQEPELVPPPRRWTPRSALARARQVLQEQGFAALWFRVLGETVYRRALVTELRLPAPVVESSPRPELEGRLLRRTDLAEYGRLRGTDADARLRLDRGDRCFGIWHDGRLVSTRWLATEAAHVDYLRRTVELSPETVYLYDVYTAPEQRGRGVGTIAAAAVPAMLAAEGRKRIVGVLDPENAAGLRYNRKHQPWGYRTVGTIGYVKIGRWRRDFGSL